MAEIIKKQELANYLKERQDEFVKNMKNHKLRHKINQTEYDEGDIDTQQYKGRMDSLNYAHIEANAKLNLLEDFAIKFNIKL